MGILLTHWGKINFSQIVSDYTSSAESHRNCQISYLSYCNSKVIVKLFKKKKMNFRHHSAHLIYLTSNFTSFSSERIEVQAKPLEMSL